MLKRHFIPAMQRKRAVGWNAIAFQQDGEICSNRTEKVLSLPETVLFRRQVNFEKDRQSKALYSPDLNLTDYFLWVT